MTKVYLETHGCALNRSDSETMAAILVESGHEVVPEEEAEVVIINSCTVKSAPEQRLFHRLRNAHKPIVVAGCVPQADPQNEHFEKVSVIGPKSLSKVALAVDEALAGRRVSYLEDAKEDRLSLPCIPRDGHLAIIPINAGCLGRCSFCKTRQARGRLHSYAPQDIERRFRHAISHGAKEVWLTSQDTGAYGQDIGMDLVCLLERLLVVPGDYRVRLGMANPQHLLPLAGRLIRVLRRPNLFRFLHVPVQSGSDDVLGDMRRGYTASSFERLVRGLVSAIPDLTIATDVIVGYPAETEEDFLATERLLRTLRIPVVNVSKFYPRPGTPAASMALLPTAVVKARSSRLKRVCESIAQERNASFVGRELSVLIDEVGRDGTLVGRSDNYVQVVLPGDAGSLGSRVVVTPSMSGLFDVRAL